MSGELKKINFTFRERGEPVYSSEDWYDLCNGYIEPEDLLEDTEQANAVHAARYLIQCFFAQAEEAGVLEWS